MRHKKSFNHLGRKSAHRKAMLANMANSLIEHKRINTTVAKAKALRSYVEPLITKSKEDNTHSRRIVFSYLKNKYAVSELFREIAPKIAERPGGYTRIIKTGFRLGDGAETAMIELVDFNEIYGQEEKKKTKTRRSRRGKGKAKASTEGDSVPTDKKQESSAAEEAPQAEQTALETQEADASPEAPEAEEKEKKEQTEAKSETEGDHKKEKDKE